MWKVGVCLLIIMAGAATLWFANKHHGGFPDHDNDLSTSLSESEIKQRALDYLLGEQGSDDLWHSPNYGNLREGAAITCLVLYTLSLYEDELTPEQRSQARKAAKKLVPGIAESGYVTNPGGPDYSNYASAMLLIANEPLGLELADETRTQLVDYLIRSQLDEEEGFEPGDDDYGGWDLSGWMKGPRLTTGTNISVTSYVLEALSKEKASDRLQQCLFKASGWVSRCQTTDGGFFFHPKKDHDGNKAGWGDESRASPRAYGSTTADGIFCLASLASSFSAEPLTKGVAWFDKQPDFSRVPGFEHETNSGTWAIGLKYYYWHSLARALGSFPAERRKEIARQLKTIAVVGQSRNGSWSNPNARMREDDPIIATCFVLCTLARAEKILD